MFATVPWWDDGRAVWSCHRLLLRRGNALACGSQERIEARVFMHRLETIVLFHLLDIVDGIHRLREGSQVDEGLIPLTPPSKDASQVMGCSCRDFMRGTENAAQAGECFPQNLFRFGVAFFFDQDRTQITQGEQGASKPTGDF